MVYHTRSKGAPPPFPSKNHKRNKKMDNDKFMGKTIEKENLMNNLFSSLEHKSKGVRLNIYDISEWAKLLPIVNPTLETNMDKHLVVSEATFQIFVQELNLPLILKINNAPFIGLQRAFTFQNTHILPNITHMILDLHILLCTYRTHTIQARQYQMPLYQICWYHTPFIPYHMPPYINSISPNCTCKCT